MDKVQAEFVKAWRAAAEYCHEAISQLIAPASASLMAWLMNSGITSTIWRVWPFLIMSTSCMSHR